MKCEIINNLKIYNFSLYEEVIYSSENPEICSLFLIRENYCLILDCRICENNPFFSYSDYTDKQNDFMFNYKQCYRFYINHISELEEIITTFNLLIDSSTFNDLENYKFMNREEVYIDNTPLESFFESCFEDAYGSDGLQYLSKEYSLTDINGRNIFVDFVLEKKDIKIAIEENGVHYHHPQLIGEERYRNQLMKQNSLVHYQFVIFRWSTEHLKFKEKVIDSIRKYFGNKSSFINKTEISASRSFKLYNHQELTLEEIDHARQNGNRSFLIVLPTGTGKSKIIEEDLFRLYKVNKQLSVLIMVPTLNIKLDWINRLNKIFFDNMVGDSLSYQIVVSTYISTYKYINELDPQYFDYIVVDEAHHAVAPAAKKTIQYFNPEFLVGLTATPYRLDNRRIEEIFGYYNAKITLEEAIKKDIISPIRAFRIESNINLSEVRFKGKDYYNTDLEKAVRITSRNELIAQILKKYFVSSTLNYKQGIIFCVNIAHTKEMEMVLQKHGISAKAVSGLDRNNDLIVEDYQNKKIQFLCACNLISEGWDSPQTSILVMARPTMSKVLYLQQLGRGLRKYENKECLYVIDVVDQYGALNSPWSVHSIFGNNFYIPFGDMFNRQISSAEMVLIDGLIERPIAIKEIDIFTFEQKYGNYLSIEQLARELFISTGTIRNWILKKEITPEKIIPFGNSVIYLFNPTQVPIIREIKKLKIHNEDSIKEDFFDFLNEKSYTFSFKIVFLLAFLKKRDKNGNVNMDDLIELYSHFYQERIEKNLKVDRTNCIYTKEYLSDTRLVKQSILQNPFEKFERKRFIYYCKDLSEIGFNSELWEKFTKEDMNYIIKLMNEHLKEYYSEMDGLQNIDYLLSEEII